MLAHPSIYVKRECYDKYVMYALDYKISADFDLLVRFISKYKVQCKYLPMDFVTMRIGGAITRYDVENLYGISKALIYPSLNESLGLGILEALNFDCDVLGPDLPYIHSVCVPSKIFDLSHVNSLVESVISYEKGICPKSVAIIKDEMDDLLNLL